MSDGQVEWYSQMFDGERWDDLKVPATGINPAGSASPPDEDTTIGGLLFASNADEIVSLVVQLPHKWKQGSTIVPHVHWTKTTSASGTVAWTMNYRWAPIGEVFDAAWTNLVADTPVAGTPDNDTANEHLISSFGEVDASGKQISDMLIIQLYRDVSEDNYGADARLLEFDIHYQIDSHGSEAQFVKQNTHDKVGL